MQNPHFVPLTPALLVAAANAFIGLVEEGDNRGQMIERFLAEVHQPPGGTLVRRVRVSRGLLRPL